MDRWMHGCMDGWMMDDGCLSGWINEVTSEIVVAWASHHEESSGICVIIATQRAVGEIQCTT